MAVLTEIFNKFKPKIADTGTNVTTQGPESTQPIDIISNPLLFTHKIITLSKEEKQKLISNKQFLENLNDAWIMIYDRMVKVPISVDQRKEKMPYSQTKPRGEIKTEFLSGNHVMILQNSEIEYALYQENPADNPDLKEVQDIPIIFVAHAGNPRRLNHVIFNLDYVFKIPQIDLDKTTEV
jgi:hypothetical protein